MTTLMKMRFESSEFEENQNTNVEETPETFEEVETINEVQDGPEPLLDFGSEEAAMKMESYNSKLEVAIRLRNEIGNGQLTHGSIAVGHYHLDQLGINTPASFRVESFKNETEALKMRCEGIIDTIWNKIVAFWEWIVEKVKSLFSSSSSEELKDEVKKAEEATKEAVKVIATAGPDFLKKSSTLALSYTPSESSSGNEKDYVLAKYAGSDDGKKTSTPLLKNSSGGNTGGSFTATRIWGFERAIGLDKISNLLDTLERIKKGSMTVLDGFDEVSKTFDPIVSAVEKGSDQKSNHELLNKTFSNTLNVLRKGSQQEAGKKLSNLGASTISTLELGFGKIGVFGLEDKTEQSIDGFTATVQSYDLPREKSIELTQGDVTKLMQQSLDTLRSLVVFDDYMSHDFYKNSEKFLKLVKKTKPTDPEAAAVVTAVNKGVSGLVRISSVYRDASKKLSKIHNGMADAIAKNAR